MNPPARPPAAASTALVPYIPPNPPKPVTAGDRLRRRIAAVRPAIRAHLADLRARLTTWPGWDRPPATRGAAWRRSGALNANGVPADSQLLIFFWQASNYTDRFAFFAVAILVDLCTRRAGRRTRNILLGPLYHLAEHPTRRAVTYLVLYVCWKAAS